MTRFNLALFVLLAVAVAGLFFWVLQIRGEQHAGRVTPGAASSGPPGDADSARVRELERTVIDLREMVRSQEIATNRLDQRVTGMEVADVERDRRIAALARGEAVPEAAVAADDRVLSSAIEQVLDRRAEAERMQRLERTARGMSRYLLADVPATDAQKEEFVKVVVAYIDGRDRVRRATEEDDRGAANSEAELAALEAVRDEEIQRIFGADGFARISERLNRGRRGGDARPGGEGRPGRDLRPFGPGRTSPQPR